MTYRSLHHLSLSLFLQNLNLPHGRVVFEVTLEGSARKLVTVRSSLILNNQLSETVEVKLENTCIHPGGNSHKIGENVKDLDIPICFCQQLFFLGGGCLNMTDSCTCFYGTVHAVPTKMFRLADCEHIDIFSS